jgi:hypothetical protein
MDLWLMADGSGSCWCLQLRPRLPQIMRTYTHACIPTYMCLCVCARTLSLSLSLSLSFSLSLTQHTLRRRRLIILAACPPLEDQNICAPVFARGVRAGVAYCLCVRARVRVRERESVCACVEEFQCERARGRAPRPPTVIALASLSLATVPAHRPHRPSALHPCTHVPAPFWRSSGSLGFF